MYSCSEPLTPTTLAFAATASAPAGIPDSVRSPIPTSLLAIPVRRSSSCQEIFHGDGLLHDARNLIGALGLYCDLLAMPDVLKVEHRHYAEEVRLLGDRSFAMIQQLLEKSVQSHGAAACSWLDKAPKPCDCNPAAVSESTSPGVGIIKPPGSKANPVNLRSIVEHCSGLLGRVACGKTVEIRYGVASDVPVRVEEEAIERILVNLVRNSIAALAKREPTCSIAADCAGTNGDLPVGSAQDSAPAGCGRVREIAADPTDDETPDSIRIGIGQLENRVGDPKPWPFRRVRLTVEDSGCGMSAEQLGRLMAGGRAPSRGSHGIGFHVVRELAAASGGDLRVMSAPGVGTRVQIEWPMAGAVSAEAPQGRLGSPQTFAPDRLSGYFGPPRLGGLRRITGPRMMATVQPECSAGTTPVAKPNLQATGRPSC